MLRTRFFGHADSPVRSIEPACGSSRVPRRVLEAFFKENRVFTDADCVRP